MYFDEINIAAVLVVAVINIALGMLWYSPFVLGKLWMDAMGWKEEECHPSVKDYLGAIVVALVTTWVLALFVSTLSDTVWDGLKVGFLIWLGFIATSHFSGVLWAKKPLKAYLIDAGFYLVYLLIGGGILAAWQ